jgi:hypothetical protein
VLPRKTSRGHQIRDRLVAQRIASGWKKNISSLLCRTHLIAFPAMIFCVLTAVRKTRKHIKNYSEHSRLNMAKLFGGQLLTPAVRTGKYKFVFVCFDSS